MTPAGSARRASVSVIVVNYNGLRFLEACLDGLQRAFERHDAEIIVVDNASTDGSLAWLRARADITLVALTINTGFTGGNNAGARLARGDVLLLINNDTLVPGPLDALVDAALDPVVGAAGCQLRYGDGRLQHSIGLAHTLPRLVLSWLGLEKHARAPALLRKYETAAEVYATAQGDVAWVSGACLATRRAVWERLGGLDDDLFMYCEDVDYGRRVHALGLRVVYSPAPVVTHFEGGGGPWIGSAALRRTARSYFIYTRKCSGPAAARALGALLGTVFAARGLAFRALAVCAKTPAGRNVRHAKAGGYRAAAAQLWRAALTGRMPAST